MTFSTSAEYQAWVARTFQPAPGNLAPGIGVSRVVEVARGEPYTCAHGRTMGVSCEPCGRSVTTGGGTPA